MANNGIYKSIIVSTSISKLMIGTYFWLKEEWNMKVFFQKNVLHRTGNICPDVEELLVHYGVESLYWISRIRASWKHSMSGTLACLLSLKRLEMLNINV